MNNRIPLEYVTSFADANQAMMQQLTSALLTSGDSGADFSRFAEIAVVQQNYLAEMSALWVNTLMPSATTSPKTDKSDRRFAGDQWKQSPHHNFLKDMYLVNTRYVNNLIERAIVDEKTRGRLRFFARQISGCSGVCTGPSFRDRRQMRSTAAQCDSEKAVDLFCATGNDRVSDRPGLTSAP